MDIKRAYLHWSATPYNWKEAGHYHTVITGDGQVHRLTPYQEPLYEHTYGRNHDSVALAVACMGGTPWEDYPPTAEQLDALCKETAKIALGRGWPADPDRLKHLVMTHAEAAALRDFQPDQVAPFSGKSPSADWDHAAQAAGLPHANYGPATWPDGWPGGDVVRWDLFQLHKMDKPGSGGFFLRQNIVAWMKRIQAEQHGKAVQ